MLTLNKYRDYLKTMAKFTNYSATNTLLIKLQKPDSSYVAGYQSWQKNFGRTVKQGEHAIRIIAPAPYKKTVETPVLDQNGSPVISADGSQLTKKPEILINSFKVVPVFDISQTTGPDLPEICHILDGKVEGFKDLDEAITRFSPVPIKYEHITSGANGFFSQVDKSITIRDDLPEMQRIKTTIHEIAHSILHDRDTGESKGADSRTKEVQAESVAFVCCQKYGINASDYSFGYLANWSSGKDIRELKESLDVIQKTSNTIINGIDRELDILQKEHETKIIKEENISAAHESTSVMHSSHSLGR